MGCMDQRNNLEAPVSSGTSGSKPGSQAGRVEQL
jgi:hypothetical protein